MLLSNRCQLWRAIAITVLLVSAAQADPVTFSFSVRKAAALTSAGVFDNDGHLMRQLWALKPLPAGRQTATWDGLDENGAPVEPGKYLFRVIVNNSTYRNIGVVGNTGQPAGEPQHIQHGVMSVTVDATGNIYTANGWEEAGHDFKVQDPDGKTLFHARYQIRNGKPNGAPHAIAVDDTHIYCATHGWNSEQWKSKQQIQRFCITNGNHEVFTDAALTNNAGHIQLYEWPEKQIPAGTPELDAKLMEKPVRALAVRGDTIFATDCLGNKVHKFHKVTGVKLGEFPVKFPHALAIDAQGRLWVGHEHHKVTVFDADGKDTSVHMEKLGDIRSLAFTSGTLPSAPAGCHPERSEGSQSLVRAQKPAEILRSAQNDSATLTGNVYRAPLQQLIVADGEAGQVKFYDGKKLVRTFGGKAQPGDFAPDRFYDLRGAAVDALGNLVTVAGVTGGGARIAKFAPDGKCLWEQMALMFCDVGNYATNRPDELITQRFHRLALDRKTNQWAFRGNVLDGDAKLLWGNHGVLRFVTHGTNEFVYQAFGDGMQVYRRGWHGHPARGLVDQEQTHGQDARATLYRLAAMVGGNEPGPDGRFNHKLSKEERKPVGWWSWADTTGTGKVATNDVAWFKTNARYALFGMNADAKGTLIYCEHHTKAIWELPMSGLNAAGNPVYDWRFVREIVPSDKKFQPLMAVRASDGGLYAMGRHETWPKPGGKEAGYIWMGGWALARYDAKNQRQWITKLPEVCPGLCEIPGGRGGVMAGYYKLGHVYHYEPGGLLIGVAKLGDAAGNQTGWMDNTAALAVNRDPRDGLLDVFGEDSWLNRLIWYRVDDRDVQTITGTITVKR